jgi:Uma2 family endonuclease
MSIGTPIHEPRFLLRQASWQDYVSLRDADANRNTRMTFDRGRLELMSPTGLHERLKYLIGKCVDIWLEEKKIPFQCRGSTTFRRENLEQGLEPDNCYYIEHAPMVRDRVEVDLTIDPPPDLVIEVDVTSSSINRMVIYAGLRVPEIWRWHDGVLQILVLSEMGQYAPVGASQALPGFPIERMADLICGGMPVDDLAAILEFRKWCQSHT